MKPTPLVASLLVLPLAACASAGASGPDAGPPALAMAVPSGGQATYVRADTGEVEIDAGGQTVAVDQTADMTLAMSFAPDPAGVRVTASIEAFNGRIDNPMAGSLTADADDIEGPLVFTLDPTGEATLVSSPELAEAAAQLMLPDDVAATFFPRLPGRVVTAGETWTDTVTVSIDREDIGAITTNSVVTYTLRGDTAVDGRTLMHVTFSSDETRSGELESQGMTVIQDLAGTTDGFFLWDASASRLHHMETAGRYSGTMEVAMAPFPLGLVVTARSVTRLVPES